MNLLFISLLGKEFFYKNLKDHIVFFAFIWHIYRVYYNDVGQTIFSIHGK